MKTQDDPLGLVLAGILVGLSMGLLAYAWSQNNDLATIMGVMLFIARVQILIERLPR